MPVRVSAMVLVLAAAIPPTARAGRPLATDDTGTAGDHKCQVEAWRDHADGRNALTLAPACGLRDDLELDLQFARQPDDDVPAQRDAAAGLGLKWAPGDWVRETAWGSLSFGLKASVAGLRRPGQRWQAAGWGASALTMLALNPSCSVGANLGLARDRIATRNVASLDMAGWCQPGERWLGFAEVLAANEGPAVRSAGARLWLVPLKLGLDLTASRTAGQSGTAWSLGFGWYAIGWR